MALPSPTVSTPTVPYTKFTTTRYVYVPTIAVQAAPTLSEINAGKDVTPQLMAVTGFDTTIAEIALMLAGGSFAGNLPGRKTANASSMTFENSVAGPASDVRSVFTELAVASMVIFNEGIVTGGMCDIWPVRVGAVTVPQDLEAVGSTVVSFSIYRAPSTGIAIPTA